MSADVDALREAAVRVHQLALCLDLAAERIEVTGVMDDEARKAAAAARELLGSEETPCGE